MTVALLKAVLEHFSDDAEVIIWNENIGSLDGADGICDNNGALQINVRVDENDD